jgi:hypothetical protein
MYRIYRSDCLYNRLLLKYYLNSLVMQMCSEWAVSLVNVDFHFTFAFTFAYFSVFKEGHHYMPKHKPETYYIVIVS